MAAVIFDCDGVLVDSETIYSAAFSIALAEFGCALPASFLQKSLQGKSMQACYQWLFEFWQFAVTREFEARLHWHTDDLISKNLTAVAGAQSVVADIACPKAVASNGQPASVIKNLQRCNLWEFFVPHIYTANLVANPKPAPDIYQYAAAQLGVECSQCCVVEDSSLGVAAAVAAGMNVCWLTHGETPRVVPAGVQLAPTMIEVRDWLVNQRCI